MTDSTVPTTSSTTPRNQNFYCQDQHNSERQFVEPESQLVLKLPRPLISRLVSTTRDQAISCIGARRSLLWWPQRAVEMANGRVQKSDHWNSHRWGFRILNHDGDGIEQRHAGSISHRQNSVLWRGAAGISGNTVLKAAVKTRRRLRGAHTAAR